MWLLLTVSLSLLGQNIVLNTSTILDGKGHTLTNRQIVISGSQIAQIRNPQKAVAIDLTGLTVMRGVIAGPRVITSLRIINENTGSPEQIREFVRKLKADGADVVKLFATKSIRDGGTLSMSKEQIDAACSEAKAQGLRAAVHAHAS